MSPATVKQDHPNHVPPLFSYGFRPFFLFGSLYAAILMALWVPWYLGFSSLPVNLPHVAWHVHELLFGYVSAAIAGFLLTALPSWTGRPPIVGKPLAALVALWLAGRLAVALSSMIGLPLMALLCIAFPSVLLVTVGREILSVKDWRNVKVLLVLAVFLASQLVFYWEVWHFGYTVTGDRLAVVAVLLMLMLVAGRIIPSFTGNWLKMQGELVLPAPFSHYDRIAVAVATVALFAWAVNRSQILSDEITGTILLLSAGLHFFRQSRWRPHRTLAEPLVAILHAAYLFIPIGFGLAAYAELNNHAEASIAASHAWSSGTIGIMTLAVMTRASLGHTGRPLRASSLTQVIYLCMLLSATTRIIAAMWPVWTMIMMPLAGLSWVAAFLGFIVLYGPMLVTARCR